MRFKSLVLACLFLSLSLSAQERENIWPKGKMPDASDKQIAAMTSEANAEGFNPKKHRQPYLEWFEKPSNPNGTCMILISGGSYKNTCDVDLIALWRKELTAKGVQCVNFVYRTPRPEGMPYYRTAWEDGQRAVRKVRSQAAKRGFDPEKIGVVGMSAGGHLSLLLGTGSQTTTYDKVDAVDDIPCHINIAIVNAPAYVTTDADELGIPASRQGYGADVTLSGVFPFDEKTCITAALTSTPPTAPPWFTASSGVWASLPNFTSIRAKDTVLLASTVPWNSLPRWDLWALWSRKWR